MLNPQNEPNPSSDNANLELLKAVHNVRLKVGALTKDKKNPFTKSNYVTLTAIYQQLLEPMAEVGLYVTTQVDMSLVRTTIQHTSGAKLVSEFPLSGTTAQEMGAAVTYGTRYNLFAMLALPQEDDDGNTASGRTQHKPPMVHNDQPF